MKISGETTRAPRPFPSTIATPSPDSDLQPHRRPSRRHPRTPARLKRLAGASAGKRSRPETPLSKWKIHGGVSGGGDPLEELDREKELPPPAAVSVRKLAASLWRLQLPETAAGDGGRRRGLRKIGEDRLGVVEVKHYLFSVIVLLFFSYLHLLILIVLWNFRKCFFFLNCILLILIELWSFRKCLFFAYLHLRILVESLISENVLFFSYLHLRILIEILSSRIFFYCLLFLFS